MKQLNVALTMIIMSTLTAMALLVVEAYWCGARIVWAIQDALEPDVLHDILRDRW